MIDPNGGYYNMSSSGQAQAKKWFANLAEDRAHHRGRFSFENLYANYTDALDELWQQHYGNRLTRDNNDYKYLEDLYKLNNEFMGLGLDGAVLSSGRDLVTASTLESDYGKDLMWDLTSQNGSRQKAQDMANAAYALKDPGTSNFDNVEGAWINACNQRQRDFTNKWREEKHRKMDVEEAAEKAKKLENEEYKKQNFGTGNVGGVCSAAGTSTLNPSALMKSALTFAGGASAADGPLPIGEIVGGIALAGTSVYVVSQNPESALRIASFVVTGSLGVYADLFGRANGKGERNWAGKADGTDNPWKKLRDDPKNPNNVRWKDQNGKWRSKPKPPGWDNR